MISNTYTLSCRARRQRMYGFDEEDVLHPGDAYTYHSPSRGNGGGPIRRHAMKTARLSRWRRPTLSALFWEVPGKKTSRARPLPIGHRIKMALWETKNYTGYVCLWRNRSLSMRKKQRRFRCYYSCCGKVTRNATINSINGSTPPRRRCCGARAGKSCNTTPLSRPDLADVFFAERLLLRLSNLHACT